MPQMRNVGIRLPEDLLSKLEDRAAELGTDKSTVARNAIAIHLGSPLDPMASPVLLMQQIADRLSRIENALNLPRENALEGGTNESQVSFLPKSPYLLSEWVNVDALIVCPHCGSLDSDWAESYSEDAELKAIACHQCGKTSAFDMTR